MNVRIESLKQEYIALNSDCESHFGRIQKALRSCSRDIEKIREGYTEKWQRFNRLNDFLKANLIRFHINYGEQTIDYEQ